MQSFGWKRKARIQSNVSTHFNSEDSEEEIDSSVDWLTAAKRSKVFVLEDRLTKAKRLTNEGITLAGEERWWEAIGRWNDAIAIHAGDHTVLDMLAQAYMQVGEIYSAVSSALKATKLCPNWWPGHQTLGRAQLGIGEVGLAIKSFSRAIRLSPEVQELWTDDLQWTVNLKTQQFELEKESRMREKLKEEESSLVLQEINELETQSTSEDGTGVSSYSVERSVGTTSSQTDEIGGIRPKCLTGSLVKYRR